MQDFYGFFYENKVFYKVSFVLITSVITLFFAKKIFYNIGFVDKPNYRSNHKKPVSLGGGIIVIPLIVFTSVIYNYNWDKNVLITLTILFLISLFDDIKNIKPLPRLLCHFSSIALFIVFYITPQINDLIKQNIFIFYISTIFMIISVTWFINAFNFMDGINGITSVETISICAALLFINYFLFKEVNLLALAILSVTTVFCYFNWTPTKIFLGDSGSISLGFLSSFLLIELAIEGFWLSAIILPLYYIIDTSLTLLIRVFKREKFWQAHKEHFYQKAIQNGFTHSNVSLKLILINFGLFLLSFSALIYKNEIIFFIIGLVWCSFFMYLFSKKNN